MRPSPLPLALHPLLLFTVPSCFLRLRPRLAVARQQCVSAMCPATGLPWKLLGQSLSFAVTLRSRVERFDHCAQKLCELLDGAGVTPSFTRLFIEVRRHLSELQLVDVRRRLIEGGFWCQCSGTRVMSVQNRHQTALNSSNRFSETPDDSGREPATAAEGDTESGSNMEEFAEAPPNPSVVSPEAGGAGCLLSLFRHLMCCGSGNQPSQEICLP